MLTCKRLLPAATRALYFPPEFSFNSYPECRTDKHRKQWVYRASLFRQTLLDKPELTAMIRNLTNLPMLVVALPTTRENSSTASATYRSLVQDKYQRQVLRLATAAKSVGVVLTDVEHAPRVGAVLATRQLSHLRVAYRSNVEAPIAAFAAFLKGLRSNSDGNTPRFPALQICTPFNGYSGRPRPHIDRARKLKYEVIDLEIAVEWVDIARAAYVLPRHVAKLEKLRYHLPFEPEADPDLGFEFDGFYFDATKLEWRVKHNAIKAFAIECDAKYEQEVPFEYYWEPEQYKVMTIKYLLALFRLFPSLEELVLSHGGEMTIEKLELLADTSPNLKILRLPDTFWEGDLDLVEHEPGQLCPFEAQLSATLERFDSLEFVELGVLPSECESPGKAFRHWEKQRKLEVAVGWCSADPFFDGELSDDDSSSA